MTHAPKLIAHRGNAERYPENSLAALQSAAEAGVEGLELDVQFSGDGVPVVIHDHSLARLTGIDGSVSECTLEQLHALSAHEPERFGDRFRPTPIHTLTDTLAALQRYADLTVFVEIKRDTLAWHDTPAGVQAVLQACAPLAERLVVISFDERILREARSLGKPAVGLVLSAWDANEWERADALEPEYLFCSRRRLPPAGTPLWEGAWQWVVYEINDAEQARALAARGADWIETRDVEPMAAALRSD